MNVGSQSIKSIHLDSNDNHQVISKLCVTSHHFQAYINSLTPNTTIFSLFSLSTLSTLFLYLFFTSFLSSLRLEYINDFYITTTHTLNNQFPLFSPFSRRLPPFPSHRFTFYYLFPSIIDHFLTIFGLDPLVLSTTGVPTVKMEYRSYFILIYLAKSKRISLLQNLV